MKPFDLEKALAGEKVITGERKEVTELTYFKTINDSYKIRAVIDGELVSFTEEGQWETDDKNKKMDLFMAPVQRTQYMIQHNGVLEIARYDNKENVNLKDGDILVTITWEE